MARKSNASKYTRRRIQGWQFSGESHASVKGQESKKAPVGEVEGTEEVADDGEAAPESTGESSGLNMCKQVKSLNNVYNLF